MCYGLVDILCNKCVTDWLTFYVINVLQTGWDVSDDSAAAGGSWQRQNLRLTSRHKQCRHEGKCQHCVLIAVRHWI